MPASTHALFQPLQVKSLALPNRIVMAPMTRSFSPEGVPGADVAAYYGRRAPQVGLIVSEGVAVERPAAKNDPDVPHLYGAAALAGWAQVVERVHAEGGRIAPQLWHVGSFANPNTGWLPPGVPESPSGLSGPGASRGNAMSEEDIADTIAAFGRAAANARQVGFDAIEIHGAHGYLIDQFFWSGTNGRRDPFGGATIAERSRFAAEVVKAVRDGIGPDAPLILRLSQWKQQDYSSRLVETPDRMVEWLTPLIEAGVDVLHCSQRRFWEPEFPDIDGPVGLNFAGWAKKLTGAVTITVGSVGLSSDFMGVFTGKRSAPASLDALLERLERNEFDLVAVGRALLSDANWVRKVRDGDHASLTEFDPATLGELV